MAWLLKKRRGPAWKQGWTRNTLSSISAPPLQLVAIVGIVMFLLMISSYTNCKSTIEKATISLDLFLLVLPLLLLFIARFISRCGVRLVLPAPLKLLGRARARAEAGAGGSPWGVAALVVLLLVLVYYRSNFIKAMWSPLIWRSY